MQKAVSEVPLITVNDCGRMEKVMVDAAGAAGMFSLGRSTWLRNVSAGKTPAMVKLGGRSLWRVGELLAWAKAGCPARDKWELMKTKGIA